MLYAGVISMKKDAVSVKAFNCNKAKFLQEWIVCIDSDKHKASVRNVLPPIPSNCNIGAFFM